MRYKILTTSSNINVFDFDVQCSIFSRMVVTQNLSIFHKQSRVSLKSSVNVFRFFSKNLFFNNTSRLKHSKHVPNGYWKSVEKIVSLNKSSKKRSWHHMAYQLFLLFLWKGEEKRKVSVFNNFSKRCNRNLTWSYQPRREKHCRTFQCKNKCLIKASLLKIFRHDQNFNIMKASRIDICMNIKDFIKRIGFSYHFEFFCSIQLNGTNKRICLVFAISCYWKRMSESQLKNNYITQSSKWSKISLTLNIQKKFSKNQNSVEFHIDK